MSDFGFIYYLYDFASKQTKINKTTNHPSQLLAELTATSDGKLELLYWYESETVSQEIEQLHSLYQPYLIAKAWFQLPLSLLLEITQQAEIVTGISRQANSSGVDLPSVPKSDPAKSRRSRSKTLDNLPQDVQQLIAENAPETSSVSKKVSRGRTSYKCYSARKIYLGKIKGRPDARYWEAEAESAKSTSSRILSRIGVGKLKSFFSSSKKKRRSYSSSNV